MGETRARAARNAGNKSACPMPSEFNHKLLLVEDDLSVAKSLGAVLERYETTHVTLGENAIQKIFDRYFDLLIVDHKLPDMTGLDVVRAVRRRDNSIPIVMVTGYPSQELLVHALRLGVQDFFTKPYDVFDLRDSVARLLYSHSMGSLPTFPVASAPFGAKNISPEFADSRPVPTVRDSRIRKVIEYMYEHFTEDLTVDGLAEIACLSRYHFCRSFRRACGTTVMRFLKDLRLAQARTLLITTDLSVTEVALSAGFKDLSHFERTFRTKYRTTPSRYRRLVHSYTRLRADRSHS